jgi:prolyl 4-hydroxylase
LGHAENSLSSTELVSCSRLTQWCDDGCYDDPAHQRMMSRAELLLGPSMITRQNFEHTQLLRYYPGQYYERHTDFIDAHLAMPMGPRILTLFVYLSDVIEGGGTDFPELDLTVQPRKGSAVLWPSVLNESPREQDVRADHEALPVLKGVKYGANIWVHQRDYKAAYAKDCG